MVNHNDFCPCPETEEGVKIFVYLYPELAPFPASWDQKQCEGFQTIVNKMIDKGNFNFKKKETEMKNSGENAYDKNGGLKEEDTIKAFKFK